MLYLLRHWFAGEGFFTFFQLSEILVAILATLVLF